jgi:hypothetical protein
MSTVLALEPDVRRTDFLRAVVCERLRARLVVADTLETALAAISALFPDVVLVGPDFPPREEIEIRDYLRSLQRSTPLEIVRMPAPSQCAPRARTRPGLLGALRRRAASISEQSSEQDDFTTLAGRITGALDRVRSARANAPALVSTAQPVPEWCATRGPDPVLRTAADSSKPAVTPGASRSDAELGESLTNPTAAGTAAGAPPDGADDNQNEWGLFDPSRCGYAALAATIDTSPEELPQSAGLSPADMLLQFETAADPAARPQPPAMPASVPTCQEAPTAARRERKRGQPAPLALWAHLFGWEGERSGRGSFLRYTDAMAGVAALLVGLNIPAQIAAVAYGSGCRVHRVRGLACTESTATTFEVASSQPDSSSIFHPGISAPNPAA